MRWPLVELSQRNGNQKVKSPEMDLWKHLQISPQEVTMTRSWRQSLVGGSDHHDQVPTANMEVLCWANAMIGWPTYGCGWRWSTPWRTNLYPASDGSWPLALPMMPKCSSDASMTSSHNWFDSYLVLNHGWEWLEVTWLNRIVNYSSIIMFVVSDL